jgi:hypothetical protein
MKNTGTTDRATVGRNTLRLLCSVLIKPGTRLEICQMIDPGVFSDVLQIVVFEEIRSLGKIESKRLRELLPARITNRGFPDFDLYEFLSPSEVSEQEIEKLFESAFRLVELSETQETQESLPFEL